MTADAPPAKALPAPAAGADVVPLEDPVVPLADRLPRTGTEGQDDPDAVFEAFAGWVTDQGMTLYPAQEEALVEVVTGANVVVATPTGSGKSTVALGAHCAAMSRGVRSFYVAPLKALVSEKFFALVDVLGAENVGMMTGDATVNGSAPVICATAEVLANIALRDGPAADVGQVVLDEFHYYADPERGWAWQVPLLELPHCQFVLMSGTLGDTRDLRADLERRTGRTTTEVASAERPVPLTWRYATTPVHETVQEILETHGAPLYVVHTTQADAAERAQALMSLRVVTDEQKRAIAAEIGDFRFARGFGKVLSRFVRQGIGVHHAGMLPKYRRLVERLTQRGLLRVVCGTDTLGVGINVPIRTVLFTSLVKYDGVRVRHYTAREFHQIAGRAGRAGFDTVGNVVVQAPEHAVENARLRAKAGDDPKKQKKMQLKKPPEGRKTWEESTFERLRDAEPEPLRSSMRVSAGTLLLLLRRPDPVAAATHLLLTNHSTRAEQRALVRRALALYRSLLDGNVVERVPDPAGRPMRPRLVDDLQAGFALDQPLAPFALAAQELLDEESPTYALDVLSVLEATLDDPRQVLQAQRHRARGEAVAEMKREGIEYDERMELLEEITWPRPLTDLLEPAFETYAQTQPWVADYELAPKSVARDMSERGMTFTEYVSFYGLARSEGLVLRYLSDAYRALRKTVPDDWKTEPLADLEAWLGAVVRQTDSSLLDEWEALAAGDESADGLLRAQPVDTGPPPITADKRAFRVLVRNAMWRRVQLLARRDWAGLAALDEPADDEDAAAVPDEDRWDADRWRAEYEPYFDEHAEVLTGADARGPDLFQVDEDPEGAPARTWRVRQVLDDPEGHRDWAVMLLVDLVASDETGAPVLTPGELRN